MASPQVENGYTKIANEIMDALISYKLSGQALRIVLLVIRKTYGFNKKEDAIALSQMEKITGCSKIRCSQVINYLQDMKIVTVTENINGIGKKYKFNKDFETWLTVNKNINSYKKTKETVNKKRKRPLIKSDSTKDILTKETITKETITKDINTLETVNKNINGKAKEFIAQYCESFKVLYRENPIITPKDAGIVKRLLKIPEIESIMERFFKSKDKFIVQNCHALNIIESQINKLLVGDVEKLSGIKSWLEKKEKENAEG